MTVLPRAASNQVDELSAASSLAVNLVIYAEGDASAAFVEAAFDVSRRVPTSHAVTWQPGTTNDPGCEAAPRCGQHSPQCVLRGNPRACRPQCWQTVGCTVSTPELGAVLQVRKTPNWLRSWANFSLSSCIPTGMHGQLASFGPP